MKKINTGLKNLLEDANKRYKLGLASDNLLELSKDFVLRPGKRIRPLLFILSYNGYSKNKKCAEKLIFTSAASIELLHDYMLIHDDVIDNSSLRRGKPTLHKMFDKKIRLPGNNKIGASLAIIAGDILFALGIEAFLSIKENSTQKELALKKLLETAVYTGTGEFIDIVYGYKNIKTLSEENVFLIYSLKTAKYTFECPLLMGAILAGADQNEQKKLSRLGMAAGQAFQIYDDFLDIFASEKTIGKPILSDLNESKKTLLVYKAFENLKGKQKKQFTGILEGKNKTLKDLEIFRELILESGSYDYCFKKMSSLQNTALESCDNLHIKADHKEAIRTLITKLSPSVMPIKIT